MILYYGSYWFGVPIRRWVVVFVLGILSMLLGYAVSRLRFEFFVIDGYQATPVIGQVTLGIGVVLVAVAVYRKITEVIVSRSESRQRAHTFRNVLRLVFFLLVVVALLGIFTDQWVGVLFSLGILGFAVTFALQQPLLSLIGWGYILINRPYQVGDRVRIESAKGDVIDVDFLVTTLWEINGDLVSSNQPSGRVVTVPNSVVLSSEVFNYSWVEFPYVWNELSIQVAYESDIEFARQLMRSVADDYLGDAMAKNVQQYRQVLEETPVELKVRERPSVNIYQEESWVAFRLRYLVHPKRGQLVRNELYEQIIAEFNNHPERVKFPIGRNR